MANTLHDGTSPPASPKTADTTASAVALDQAASPADGFASDPEAPARAPADGRWTAVGVLVLGVLLWHIVAFWAGPDQAWLAAGVTPIGKHFADLYAFPAAASEFARNSNPYLANPSDPWNRAFNYPRAWLLFMRFSMDAVPAIGTALCLFWLGSTLWWWGRLTARTGLLAGAFLLSPSVVLALERANNDLLVLLMVVLALVLLRRTWCWVAWVLMLMATCLKLFPFFGFAAFLRLGWRRAWPWLLWATVSTGIFVLARLDDLFLVQKNVPTIPLTSYGASVWQSYLTDYHPAVLTRPGLDTLLAVLSMFGACALPVAAAVAGMQHNKSPTLDDNSGALDGFRTGVMVYAGTFAFGSNYSYRLIFVLLCLPWLFHGSRLAAPAVASCSRLAIGCMGLCLWIYPAWWVPLIHLRVLASWGLLAALAWLFGLTLPGVEKPSEETPGVEDGRLDVADAEK